MSGTQLIQFYKFVCIIPPQNISVHLHSKLPFSRLLRHTWVKAVIYVALFIHIGDECMGLQLNDHDFSRDSEDIPGPFCTFDQKVMKCHKIAWLCLCCFTSLFQILFVQMNLFRLMLCVSSSRAGCILCYASLFKCQIKLFVQRRILDLVNPSDTKTHSIRHSLLHAERLNCL